jgi:phosphatidylinositol alpha-1,6-mannosyltransferase
MSVASAGPATVRERRGPAVAPDSTAIQNVLVMSPDFPPARGGIQVLTHRVVASWERLRPVVVTLGAPGAHAFDSRTPFRVKRVNRGLFPRPALVGALNASGVAAAITTRPRAVLSAHIVTAPGAAFVAKRLGIPWLQYVHAKEVGAKPSLAHFALSRADAVIVVSEYAGRLATAAGAPAERLVRISPGVDVPERRSRSVVDRPGPPSILSIARLMDRYKGHDVLMRAMPLIRARVPDVVWSIVGDGHLRKPLEQRARALGITGSVDFRGSVSDAERDRLLDSAHVFCMVSRLPAGGYAGEGFGIVYLEANAHELPVVAGNVGGATDAVVDGVTGLLVDPRDHVAVADAHVRLLSDPEYAARLGSQGRERAEGYAWPHISRKVEAAVLELIG